MKLTPAIVRPTDFHKGGWLRSGSRPAWYYFKRKRRGSSTVLTRAFMRTVDRPLRDLVRFLHARGIGTTPSCSGHHHSRRELAAMHAALLRDRDAIRNGGLKLCDVETGSCMLHRDRHYDLPWDVRDFIAKLSQEQHKGVIGLRLGRRTRIKERLERIRIQGVSVKEHDGFLFLHTTATSERRIAQLWRKITVAVKRAVG